MKDTPTVTAWESPEHLRDESIFTPWADPGWLAWNGQSPELEVCEFVRLLIKMMQPSLVLETGVGQGYMTRTIAPMLGPDQMLIAYESDDGWREALWSLPFWRQNRFAAQLSHNPSPLDGDLQRADLCVLDSAWDVRFDEVRRWHEHAYPGAVAIIHDTSEQPDTIHASVRRLIREIGMTGVFLKNPRGCFMAVKA